MHHLESQEMVSLIPSDGFQFDFAPVERTPIEDAVVAILQAVGEDPAREGLRDTPQRVARAYEELLSGYRVDPAKMINNALFDVDYDDMVVVRDVDFTSLCEHHLLPFYGRAHVAYVPGERVLGLSKIPRVVDSFARRLQIQERLTRQIADFLNEVLAPKGVAVVLSSVHMCSTIRGVHKHGSSMVTSAMLGAFRDDNAIRQEFLSLINLSAKT
jgi:GTP cyclohydrolase IA